MYKNSTFAHAGLCTVRRLIQSYWGPRTAQLIVPEVAINQKIKQESIVLCCLITSYKINMLFSVKYYSVAEWIIYRRTESNIRYQRKVGFYRHLVGKS